VRLNLGDACWISIRKKYPAILAEALNMLFQLSNSYLCEEAFSCLKNIKIKERSCQLSV